MLKKTLVALAIASVAGAATAADIQTNTTYSVLSEQGANVNQDLVAYDSTFTANGFVANNSIVVTLDGEYSVGDIITFTFAGGELDTASVTNATAAVVGLPTNTKTSSMVLGLLNKSKSEIKYRVTELSFDDTLTEAEKTTIGATLVLGGYKDNADPAVDPISFDTASVLASKQLSVSYAAETSTGIELDKGSKNSTVIFDVKNQYEAEVTHAFDAIIDVNTHRLSFVTPTGNTNYSEDSVSLDAEEVIYKSSDATPVVYPYTHSATAKEVVYQINGDFSFLGEANDEGVITTSKVDFNGADKGVVYADKLVATYSGLTTNNIPAVLIDVNTEGTTIGQADAPLKTQEFTADVTLDYTMHIAGQGQVQLLTAANAGKWTLNGAIVHVPFMPFRSGYSPIVNVSNTSSQDGDIEVLVYAENDASWVEPASYMLPVTAKAESQTNITKALQEAGIQGDVAFDIIVNAPRDDIEVNALFYRDGDRAVINTVKQK